MTRKPLNMASNRRLEEIYASLPTVECKRLCQESCGPIIMSKIEWQKILNRRGREVPPILADMNCPLLKKGACSVHDIRPIICRLWGVVEGMPCTFGCVPSRVMTDDEARTIIDEIMLLETP